MPDVSHPVCRQPLPTRGQLRHGNSCANVPLMTDASEAPLDSGAVAVRLARALDERGTEYALGGAIALGFWGQPRGTMDVDLTLFLSKDKPSEVIWELQEIGCEVSA